MVNAMGAFSAWLAQTEEPGVNIQDFLADITTFKLIRAALSIAVAYAILWALRVIIDQVSERVPRRFRLAIKQSAPFLKALVLTLLVIYLIQLFIQISGTNVLALTGTVAVALGFAFKDYVSSLFAGIVTLFEGPYRVGDRVKIGDTYGEVVDYGLRGVRIRTPDDNTVTIPHNVAWTESLSNANSGQLEAQVVTDFYFAHNVDADKVLQILYQAAYSSRYTQLKLPVVVIMEEQPWATRFKLKAYPMDARDEFVYKTDLIFRAKQAFARQRLAYPELTGLAADRGDGSATGSSGAANQK
jgi:small-conductance mechanosensitive channel